MFEEDDHDEDADDDVDDDDDADDDDDDADDDVGCIHTHLGSGWEGGWGGGAMMTTLLRRHPGQSPEEPFYCVFAVLSRCRTILYSHQAYFWTL